MLGLVSFLSGPFYTENSLAVMLTGLILQGAFQGPLVILNMPEMIVATELEFPETDMDRANNLLSAIFCTWYGVGQALGPILGSIIYELLGWHVMCDFVGSFCLVFAMCYLIFAEGCEAFRLSFRRRAPEGVIQERMSYFGTAINKESLSSRSEQS